MVALSKFALVVVVLLNCGLCTAVAVLTKPLWAKERPLYVGDFGPRLVSSNGDFVLPNHSRVQWTIRSYRSLGADSSPRQPMDCGVSREGRDIAHLAHRAHPHALHGSARKARRRSSALSAA